MRELVSRLAYISPGLCMNQAVRISLPVARCLQAAVRTISTSGHALHMHIEFAVCATVRHVIFISAKLF